MTHPFRPLFRELSAEEREAIRVAARRAPSPATVLALRSGGKELAAGSEERAELLQAAVDRKDVSIEVELLAYEQQKDQPNRNFVRFRDAAMTKLGSSGKGTPFLRDHRQYDSTAIGGRVVSSKTVKVAPGHYQVLQTVRLTEPSAVERALRGLMGAVSIGWEETAPVICTACGSEVFDECWHWPGAVITREDGTEERAEWEYTGAALIETSEVPIGGVPTAGLEGIRAALAALSSGGASYALRDDNSGPEPQKGDEMKTLKEALAAKLGIGATASDDEFITAVDNASAAVRAELKVVKTERDELATAIAAFREKEAKHEEDDFILAAKNRGALKPAHEDEWRDFYRANKAGAIERMSKRADHSETPVGQPRQSAAPAPAAVAAPVQISERQRRINAQLGMTDEQYIANLQKGARLHRGGN